RSGQARRLPYDSPAGQLTGFKQVAVALAAAVLLGFGLLQPFQNVGLCLGFFFLDLLVFGLGQKLADRLAIFVLFFLAHAGVAHIALGLDEARILLAGVVFGHPFLIERRQS